MDKEAPSTGVRDKANQSPNESHRRFSVEESRPGIAAADLYIQEITAAGDPSFADLYALYARLFPLPDEREPPEAFFEILKLNQQPDVQREFGPWREIVSAVHVRAGGPVAGGHVFGVTTSRAHLDFGCLASVQAIYTFFDPSIRGRTPMARIKRYLRTRALQTFNFNDAPRVPPLIFLEVNNPLRMSAEEIAQDMASSGIDPHRRYRFWQRSGFKPLDFLYVQPRLRPEAQPVRYLDLFCSGDVASVPSRVIASHLRAFVSISVLKGRSAHEDPDFVAMHERLTAKETVRFVADDRADQRAIRGRARELARTSERREAAR